MEIVTVIKKKPNSELITYAYQSIENAIESFPIIGAWQERYWEMSLPSGMTIHNREININVKTCFVY
jgi:hypothetical protein